MSRVEGTERTVNDVSELSRVQIRQDLDSVFYFDCYKKSQEGFGKDGNIICLFCFLCGYH